jgi:hypothetical protein
MKRIPIRVAKKLAKELDQSIVVIITWEGESCGTPTGQTHVVTYGKTKAECGWAANLGNIIKRDILKWPEELCNTKPDKRVLALKEEKCLGLDNGTGDPCCERAGMYNGFGSDGPLIFTCPKQCMCHD